MIETIDFLKININQLQKEFNFLLKNYRVTYQTKKYGGIALQEDSMNRSSPWLDGTYLIKKNKLNIQKQLEDQILPDYYFRKINNFNAPGFLKIIDNLEELGLFPSRSRISILEPRSSSPIHTDVPEGMYGVRLHIPIFTNPKAFLSYPNGRFSLKPGVAYVIRTDIPHRIINLGSVDRVHFVTTIYDTGGLTAFPLIKGRYDHPTYRTFPPPFEKWLK